MSPALNDAVEVETSAPTQLQVTGHVTALATVAIQSRVNGVLEKVYFQEGEEVREGDLIFSIDPRPFQAVLNLAKADLERDKAMLRFEQNKARWNAELFRQGIIPRNICNLSCTNADALAAAIVADEAALDIARTQRSFCDIHSPINGRTGTIKVGSFLVERVRIC